MLKFNGEVVSLERFPAGEFRIPKDVLSRIRPTNVLDVRSTNAEDYLQAAMVARACRWQGARVILIVPYLPGARDDKGSLGFVPYAFLINAAHADEVRYFDAHSGWMPSRVLNSIGFECQEAVLDSFYGKVDGVIAPDKGAISRASCCSMALRVPLYKAEKQRDPETGQLSNFTCEPLPASGRMLVVDDICDGGGTFMGLAKATGLPKERLALWVSHGVFSGKAALLETAFGEIVTTDSLPSCRNINARVVPVLDYMGI